MTDILCFKTDAFQNGILKCILLSCLQFTIQFSLTVTFHPECSDYPLFKLFSARWSVQRIHKTPFSYTYTPVFLLQTAALGTTIHPYSFRGCCNTGSIGIVKRRENKPALFDIVQRKGHAGSLAQQKGAGMYNI